MGAGNAGSGGGERNNPNYNSAGKLKDKNKIGDNKQSDAQKKSSIEKAQKKEFAKFTKENLNPNNNIQTKTTPTYERDGDGGNNNQVKVTEPVILKKNIGGTTLQTTQAKVAEDKKESEEEYDSRKTKKKGRAKNILTSSRGVTQTSPNYSLGKPTLLGMV